MDSNLRHSKPFWPDCQPGVTTRYWHLWAHLPGLLVPWERLSRALSPQFLNHHFPPESSQLSQPPPPLPSRPRTTLYCQLMKSRQREEFCSSLSLSLLYCLLLTRWKMMWRAKMMNHYRYLQLSQQSLLPCRTRRRLRSRRRPCSPCWATWWGAPGSRWSHRRCQAGWTSARPGGLRTAGSVSSRKGSFVMISLHLYQRWIYKTGKVLSRTLHSKGVHLGF